MSLVGTVVLVTMAAREADARATLGCAIFGATLIAVYAASTLSHVFQQPRARRIFRMLDQGCIYLPDRRHVHAVGACLSARRILVGL